MLALTLATTLAYAFPAGQKATYDLTVNLTGYVPILGRPQSNVEVRMAVLATGGGKDPEGNVKATCDLIEMRASMAGVPLPFTVDNVRAYFPKANLVLSPNGKVLKTDAPDVDLPIRLPALHSQRLPDISFLPVEFPAGGVEVGQSWSFVKKFGEADMNYLATLKSLEGGKAALHVILRQDTEGFEDASGGPVRQEANAARRLSTVLKGDGEAVFDVEKGMALRLNASYTATTKVTDLKSGETSERVLKATLKSERRP